MATETIIAVFKTVADAEAAATEIRAAGISPSAIEQHAAAHADLAGHASSREVRAAQPVDGERRSGMWGWLMGEDAQHDDHLVYEDTMQTGGVVLSVIVDDAKAMQVSSIIERHHPLDIDEKLAARPKLATTAATATMATAAAHPAPAMVQKAGADGVMQLSEEQLTVGKRTVDRGTARVRRYVVERPVEEQVRLRSESVRIERRPVSGTAHVAADAFSEKVIEMKETSEEAVVGKTARVVEEVVIGRDSTERVETVRDKVRREEVEVTGSANQNLGRPGDPKPASATVHTPGAAAKV